MYQNMSQMSGSSYYQYPYLQQYQRLAQLEQQQQQQQQLANSFNNMAPMNNTSVQSQNYLKGRPVVSIEEARAAQIDLDGSLFIFTDIGNQKIYTKQINLDGTASLNTYSLVENATPIEEAYVTQSELNEAINSIKEELKEERKGQTNDSTQRAESRTTKAAICAKSSF